MADLQTAEGVGLRRHRPKLTHPVVGFASKTSSRLSVLGLRRPFYLRCSRTLLFPLLVAVPRTRAPLDSAQVLPGVAQLRWTPSCPRAGSPHRHRAHRLLQSVRDWPSPLGFQPSESAADGWDNTPTPVDGQARGVHRLGFLFPQYLLLFDQWRHFYLNRIVNDNSSRISADSALNSAGV